VSSEISVVIPVYGSERIIPELISRIDRALTQAQYKYELILVCDSSPDESWQVIKGLKTEYPQLKALLLRRNVGQHNAIMAGLAKASAQVIVTMDDDLQHDPFDIPKLVTQIESGADVVYGEFHEREHALWKKLGSYFTNAVATRVIGKPKGLYLSPFRAIKKEIVDDILRFKGPYAYVDGLIIQATSAIKSVPVTHGKRHEGTSLYGMSKSVMLWLQMLTTTSITPLRFTALLGLSLSAFSLFLGLLLIIQKFTLDLMPIGWSSLIVTVLFVSGVQLFSLGMIGEYLGKTALLVSGKSQYNVREYIG
jgi:glycosyltransferase involved in cell wall biosynthesis